METIAAQPARNTPRPTIAPLVALLGANAISLTGNLLTAVAIP